MKLNPQCRHNMPGQRFTGLQPCKWEKKNCETQSCAKGCSGGENRSRQRGWSWEWQAKTGEYSLAEKEKKKQRVKKASKMPWIKKVKEHWKDGQVVTTANTTRNWQWMGRETRYVYTAEEDGGNQLSSCKWNNGMTSGRTQPGTEKLKQTKEGRESMSKKTADITPQMISKSVDTQRGWWAKMLDYDSAGSTGRVSHTFFHIKPHLQCVHTNWCLVCMNVWCAGIYQSVLI